MSDAMRAAVASPVKRQAAMFSIEEIMEVTGARLVAGDADALRTTIRSVTMDSRTLRRGDLFVAFKGERVDGHRFVEQSIQSGASAVLVAAGYRPSGETVPRKQGVGSSPVFVLSVADTLLAYQQLATYHRLRFDIPVVAVTGSNGKTTTKDMVARVLEQRWRLLVTDGNLNNRIGVPQTLLRLAPHHQAAVIEMGVDQKGQTARLAEIARPTSGIITNIGPDHLEFFGSMEASAEAKGEILDWLAPDAAVALNADDPYFEYLASRAPCRVVSFGLAASAQVSATDLVHTPTGVAFSLKLPDRVRPTRIHLAVPGLHNVLNALAAAAIGYIYQVSGVKIAHGLSRFKPVDMRSQVERLGGMTVIVDCYNANPASTKAALDLLARHAAAGSRTIAVLGDMLELGSRATDFHEEVGAYAAACGVGRLIACGPLARGVAVGARRAGMVPDSVVEVSDAAAAAVQLVPTVMRGDVILVKGSRGMKMERVVEALRELVVRKDKGRHQ